MMDEGRYDRLETYCGMLGHNIPFSYCRKPGADTPCPRLSGCWRGVLPVEEYSADPQPKKGKLDMILKAVEQAKAAMRM